MAIKAASNVTVDMIKSFEILDTCCAPCYHCVVIELKDGTKVSFTLNKPQINRIVISLNDLGNQSAIIDSSGWLLRRHFESRGVSIRSTNYILTRVFKEALEETNYQSNYWSDDH